MANETEAKIKDVLNAFPDPESGRSLNQMDQVRDLKIDGDRVELTVGLTTHSAPLWDETRAELEHRLREAVPGCEPFVTIEPHDRKAEAAGANWADCQDRNCCRFGEGWGWQEHDFSCPSLGFETRG